MALHRAPQAALGRVARLIRWLDESEEKALREWGAVGGLTNMQVDRLLAGLPLNDEEC